MCTVCSFYTFYITTRGQRGLQLSIIKSTILLKGQAKWNTAKVVSMNSQACHCQCYQMAHSWHILECLVGNRWTSHAELSHQKYTPLPVKLWRGMTKCPDLLARPVSLIPYRWSAARAFFWPKASSNSHKMIYRWEAREGIIIEWPLNRQFHDARDVILKSRNDVRGFPSDDDDDEMSKFTLKQR